MPKDGKSTAAPRGAVMAEAPTTPADRAPAQTTNGPRQTTEAPPRKARLEAEKGKTAAIGSIADTAALIRG